MSVWFIPLDTIRSSGFIKVGAGCLFHDFCSRRSFPMCSESSLSVMCRKSCSSVDAWTARLVAELSCVLKQQKIV